MFRVYGFFKFYIASNLIEVFTASQCGVHIEFKLIHRRFLTLNFFLSTRTQEEEDSNVCFNIFVYIFIYLFFTYLIGFV